MKQPGSAKAYTKKSQREARGTRVVFENAMAREIARESSKILI